MIKDKKSNLTDQDNYRPIAMTCMSSKILELLILNRYKDLLISNHNQFGFKEKHGTDMCVFTLQQIIEYYHSFNSPVYMCFLDALKAFDKINHWNLLAKLIKRHIPLIIIRLLYVWHSSQSFIVQWGSCLSKPFKVKNGVRQGGILSPFLFNLYLDDLSVALNDSKVGCMINAVYMNHLFYADDSVLLAPSPSGLSKLMSICQGYAASSELSYNAKKTVIMCFKPKKLNRLKVPEFKLNGRNLKSVSSHKYLGVVLNCSSKHDDDIKREVRAIYTRGNILLKHFSSCTEDVKVKLFKTYCHGLYSSQLWCNFNKSTLKRLQRAYNYVFRKLMQLDREESMSSKLVYYYVDGFKAMWQKLICGFRIRIYRSNNLLIQTVINSISFLSSKLNNVWI